MNKQQKLHLPSSQLKPVQPGAHEHVYLLIPLMHVAPFLHGDKEHSSTSRKKENKLITKLLSHGAVIFL
jgi:hypothetical protein